MNERNLQLYDKLIKTVCGTDKRDKDWVTNRACSMAAKPRDGQYYFIISLPQGISKYYDHEVYFYN